MFFKKKSKADITENTEFESIDNINEDTQQENDGENERENKSLPINGLKVVVPAQNAIVIPEKMTIGEMIDNAIDHFTEIDPLSLVKLERGQIKKEDFKKNVEAYVGTLTNNPDVLQKVMDGFSSFVWSYDVLDDLISDSTISDIKVYSKDLIRIKRQGRRETAMQKFRSEDHFRRFIEHVAVKNKVSISDQNALQNFVDKTSHPGFILRFNITTGFINSTGAPYLHIRKIPKTKYTFNYLIKAGMLTPQIARYLIGRAQTAEGILFCGKGASGKTTLMNVLLDYIPVDKSGLVIQENEELFSQHPDLMFQHTVLNRGEGKIEYTLADLARNGLLVDLDYFIIGEIKGGEALYLLNAVYTGHRGWASVHGASSTEAMNKLVDYIKYNSTYSREEAIQMLTHLNTVVFMKDFKVQEISEVEGYDPYTKNLKYKSVVRNGEVVQEVETEKKNEESAE